MNPKVKRGTFLFLCLIAGALLIPLLVALMAVAALVLDLFIPGDMPRDLEGLYGLLGSAIFGLLAGFAIGQLQFFLVKRCLRLGLPGWRMFSALGGVLGATVAWSVASFAYFQELWLTMRTPPHISVTLDVALPIMLGLGAFAGVQALVLRRRVNDAWRWLLAPKTAIGLLALIQRADHAQAQNWSYVPGPRFLLLGAAPIAALFSGIAMLRISRDIRSAKVKRDDRAHHVPAKRSA